MAEDQQVDRDTFRLLGQRPEIVRAVGLTMSESKS